jgi:hypothetical protein
VHAGIVAHTAPRLAAEGTFDHPIGTPDELAVVGETQAMRDITGRALLRGLPLIGLGALLPAPVLAADPPPVTAGDGDAATLLVILLLGSVTAGLFFASPLRRRFGRSPFASTATAAGSIRPPGAELLGRLADRLHERLAAATRRWPTMETAIPLPPMLGGDIFFDDEPPAHALDELPSTGRGLARQAEAPRVPRAPWSTGPVSAERYGPYR